jgi:hypothetical protein
VADALQTLKAEDQNLNLLLSLPGRPHPDPGPFFFTRAGPPPDLGTFWVILRLLDSFLAMRVLAGDIGGTKTAVAIAEVGPRSLSLLSTRTYPSAESGGLEQIL